MSATAYLACMDFAFIVASCASDTSSFYDLPPTEQARCACYAPTTTTVACSPTPTPTFIGTSYTWDFYQSATITVRATSHFDNAADACYGYFSAQGYSALASVLAGSDQRGGNALGWEFCGNVHSQMRSATDTATTTAWNVYSTPGLPSRVGETKTFGSCQSAYVYRPSEGTSVSGLGGVRRAVMVRWSISSQHTRTN